MGAVMMMIGMMMMMVTRVAVKRGLIGYVKVDRARRCTHSSFFMVEMITMIMHEQCSLNLKIIVFLLHGGDDDNDYAMHEQCSLNMKISDEADTVSRLIMVVAMVVM